MIDHPDRVLPLQGTSNFRDLGGYPGHGGRPLRWRRLFRSAHLAGLTAADRDMLTALGVTRAFDFRGVVEREATPYALPGLAQHALAIEPSVVQRMQELRLAGRRIDGEVAAALMCELYRSLINDQAHRFAELFEQLLQADTPAVLHCTAGKDRTGVAVALILLALGVSRDLVQQDYLLTNRHYRAEPLVQSDTPADALAVLWRVEQGFLDAALQVVDGEQGGLDRYLRRRLKLSDAARAALAARYLEPAGA